MEHSGDYEEGEGDRKSRRTSKWGRRRTTKIKMQKRTKEETEETEETEEEEEEWRR